MVDISFVITVFNKSEYIRSTIDSISRQTSNLNCEYILVDDASSDNSIEIIKEIFKNSKNYTILVNNQNVGPAISLNKGCQAASGKYLFLMDADDILVQNALKIMIDCLKIEEADFVFGGHQNTQQDQHQLISSKRSIINNSYEVSFNPLTTILKGRYVRMAYLVTKDLYLKSKGADERIFIQDESLPLRLAYHAKKMVTLKDVAVYAPGKVSSLSSNKLRQNHDKFYAYYFALLEFEGLDSFQKLEIYKRAVSCVWKAKKNSGNLINKLFLFTYLKTKLIPVSKNSMIKNLNQYKSFIDQLII